MPAMRVAIRGRVKPSGNGDRHHPDPALDQGVEQACPSGSGGERVGAGANVALVPAQPPVGAEEPGSPDQSARHQRVGDLPEGGARRYREHHGLAGRGRVPGRIDRLRQPQQHRHAGDQDHDGSGSHHDLLPPQGRAPPNGRAGRGSHSAHDPPEHRGCGARSAFRPPMPGLPRQGRAPPNGRAGCGSGGLRRGLHPSSHLRRSFLPRPATSAESARRPPHPPVPSAPACAGAVRASARPVPRGRMSCVRRHSTP